MEWWTLLLLNEDISFVFQPLVYLLSCFFFQNKNIQCTTYISAAVYCFLAKLLVTHLSLNHWPSGCQPLCHLASAFIWRYIGTLNHELLLKISLLFGFEPWLPKMSKWSLQVKYCYRIKWITAQVWVWTIIVVACPVSPISPERLNENESKLPWAKHVSTLELNDKKDHNVL